MLRISIAVTIFSLAVLPAELRAQAVSHRVVVSPAALATMSAKKQRVKRSHSLQIRSSRRPAKESKSRSPMSGSMGPISVREEKKRP